MLTSMPVPKKILLLAALAACSSNEIVLDNVAGLYGCDPCSFGGSELYLRPDGTYSECTFSDIPEFNGHFAKEERGSYSLDGHRLMLTPDSSARPTTRYVVRARNRIYMVGQDDYEKFANDNDVIEDIGLQRRPVTRNSPYICLVDEPLPD